jgi:hypothetical protein
MLQSAVEICGHLLDGTLSKAALEMWKMRATFHLGLSGKYRVCEREFQEIVDI